MQAGAAHEQLDLVVPDLHALAEGQLGVDPQDAVGAVGLGVDLSDQAGQHGVPDGTFAAGALAQLVGPGLRDTDDAAGDLDRQTVRGKCTPSAAASAAATRRTAGMAVLRALPPAPYRHRPTDAHTDAHRPQPLTQNRIDREWRCAVEQHGRRLSRNHRDPTRQRMAIKSPDSALAELMPLLGRRRNHRLHISLESDQPSEARGAATIASTGIQPSASSSSSYSHGSCRSACEIARLRSLKVDQILNGLAQPGEEVRKLGPILPAC